MAAQAERNGYSTEQRAEELYLDGIEKLHAGHGDFARATFESVIARYPATPAAASARRQLGKIYRESSADSDTASPTTGSITRPALSDAPAAPELQPARSPSWDRELRRNASIQSKLRLEAGDRVFFSAGSAELGTRARMALAAQAQWLLRWHEFEAAIEGHADEPGTDQENTALSERRAEAVRRRLIEEGVEPRRLAIMPLGRSVRLATCSDSDCRSQNRRVVTLVFAGGTRDRLGLGDGASRAAALTTAPAPVIVPDQGVGAPAGARQVGVTR